MDSSAAFPERRFTLLSTEGMVKHKIRKSPRSAGAPRTVGVDSGGTFTDFVFRAGAGFGLRKVLSTPADPSLAVIQGLGQIGGAGGPGVVHGSTVATNALLERKVARTALVTNRGFEDVVEIGRQDRARLYDLAYRRPEPLVPRELRFGVPGRIGADGAEIEPFDEAAARKTARTIAAAGVESVAVCFLFSFLNPTHESRMRDILAGQGLCVTAAHEILAEFREYERTSTTLVNACVAPVMRRYLGGLKRALAGRPLTIMQSNGGGMGADLAVREPVRTILSGPAGGAVGALAVGRAAGFERLITLDMGGTSTDVCLIDGRLPLTHATTVCGLPVKTPLIDIHTVGAGGGSLARLDAGGALAVGPQSAGADPGPICYGKGLRITVTDANLFLGRLVPERFLGGGMRLFPERLQEPFAALARAAGLSLLEIACGIVAVVNSNMERAVRVISVERGFDPSGFTLFSFGGAGGLHCAALAAGLSIPRVLVPKSPGALSALGMLLADAVRERSRTVLRRADSLGPGELDALFAPLEQRGRFELAAEGFDPGAVACERSLDMRYLGQSFELAVPLAPGEEDIASAFARLHERRFGLRFARPVVFEGRPITARILDREALRPGNRFEGPAVLAEYSATTLVPPGATAEVDPFGNLVLETGAG
jgi:N-methylhydantoinase A